MTNRVQGVAAMNRKYSYRPAGAARYRERPVGDPTVNWGHVMTIIGGGTIGLSVILFLVSMISGVLAHAAQTLNNL